MKTIAKYSRIVLALTLGHSLFACGGAEENQDGTLPDTVQLPKIDNSTPIAGVAMDGFIANGLVWVDLKDNDSVDGSEPVAYTDSQGYFSYNPNTGVNYCEAEESHLQQYCLKTGLTQGSVEVKVAKGIKVLTGVPFRNVLSTTVDLPLARSNFNSLVDLGAKPLGDTQIWQEQVNSKIVALSPLATLAHYMPENTDVLGALSILGFDFTIDVSATELIQMDYVAGVYLNTPQSYELLTANIMISSLVNSLTGTYDLAFQNIDLGFNGYPISSADSVYKGLAESLVMSINTQNKVSALVHNQTLSAVPNAFVRDEQTDQFLSAYRTRVAEQVRTAIRPTGNTISNQVELDNIEADETLTEFIIARIELVNELQKIRALRLPSSANIDVLAITSIADPVDMLDNIGTPSPLAIEQITTRVTQTISVLIDALNSDVAVVEFDRIFSPTQAIDDTTNPKIIDVDIQAIAKAIQGNIEKISDLPSGNDFALASVNGDTNILSASHLSLSGVQDGGEQGQIVVFFEGGPQDSSGSLVMCIAYNNDNDPADNISGQRFDGSWNTIGDNQNRISLLAEGFSLQMNIAGESRGSDIPTKQQIIGLQRNPNELYGKFRFTLNEDNATWHSDDTSIDQSYGLLTTATLPTTDAECASYLSFQAQ
ncbi:MAG: hypothetical protein ACI9IT_001218 [Glaciecola sp.]|jgi:hypothetical protein